MKTHKQFTRKIERTNDEVFFTVFRDGIPMKKGIITFADLPWWRFAFRRGEFDREKVMNRIYRMAHVTVDKIIHNALMYEVYENER